MLQHAARVEATPSAGPLRGFLESLRSSDGMSLVETSVALGAAAVVATSLATVGFGTVETARDVVARNDVETVGAALGQLMIDRGNLDLRPQAEGAGIELLVGPGAPPEAPADPALSRSVDGRAVVALADVLYSNAAGLQEPDRPWEPGWRGPYLQARVAADPWGHRYAVRLGSPQSPSVYVLSAGPDGRVDTSTGGSAPVTTGDDLVYLVSHGR